MPHSSGLSSDAATGRWLTVRYLMREALMTADETTPWQQERPAGVGQPTAAAGSDPLAVCQQPAPESGLPADGGILVVPCPS